MNAARFHFNARKQFFWKALATEDHTYTLEDYEIMVNWVVKNENIKFLREFLEGAKGELGKYAISELLRDNREEIPLFVACRDFF